MLQRINNLPTGQQVAFWLLLPVGLFAVGVVTGIIGSVLRGSIVGALFNMLSFLLGMAGLLAIPVGIIKAILIGNRRSGSGPTPMYQAPVTPPAPVAAAPQMSPTAPVPQMPAQMPQPASVPNPAPQPPVTSTVDPPAGPQPGQ